MPESKVAHTNPATVNDIIKNLKDFIQSKEMSKYDFPYNHELDMSSAEIVLNWLQKELKKNVNNTQVCFPLNY